MKCPIDKENISLSFLFMMFLKYQNKYYKQYLEKEDITLQQIPILLKILDHDYIYQKDIVNDLKMDNGLVTRNIRKLEDMGYVERKEDNLNRRQNIISLTTKGKDFTIKLRDEGIKREEEIMKNSNISRSELIEICIELLENSKEFNDKIGELNGRK
jgi:DNA-binding MarR family transcriptional regulator